MIFISLLSGELWITSPTRAIHIYTRIQDNEYRKNTSQYGTCRQCMSESEQFKAVRNIWHSSVRLTPVFYKVTHTHTHRVPLDTQWVSLKTEWVKALPQTWTFHIPHSYIFGVMVECKVHLPQQSLSWIFVYQNGVCVDKQTTCKFDWSDVPALCHKQLLKCHLHESHWSELIESK